jgi:general stress protein 26
MHLARAVAAVLVVIAAAGCQDTPAPAVAGPPSRERILTASRELIADVRYATLSTLNDAGAPESRLMEPFAPDEAFDIWMGTNAASSKVAEIERHGAVALLYANTTLEGYVSLTGRAVIVRDPSEKSHRWKASWTPFYKDGHRGDDYVLIRFTPTRLEISSPKQGMNNDPATWRPVTLDFGR